MTGLRAVACAAIMLGSEAVARPVATALRPPARTDDAPAPLHVGEVAEYSAKFGKLPAGSATIAVTAVEEIRGRPTWHTIFRMNGGVPLLYKVDDLMESWIDQASFTSLRFYQTQKGSDDRVKRYEIYPDSQMYIEADKHPPRRHVGVKDPLDDASFLFFLRTLPLDVGTVYESNRYFKPESNPVRVKILRREKVEVPAGTFDCIVLQPIIKTKGIFAENGHAEVWLSDDARRIVVQIKSNMSFGSINLYLKSYRPGT